LEDLPLVAGTSAEGSHRHLAQGLSMSEVLSLAAPTYLSEIQAAVPLRAAQQPTPPHSSVEAEPYKEAPHLHPLLPPVVEPAVLVWLEASSLAGHRSWNRTHLAAVLLASGRQPSLTNTLRSDPAVTSAEAMPFQVELLQAAPNTLAPPGTLAVVICKSMHHPPLEEPLSLEAPDSVLALQLSQAPNHYLARGERR
jgi:hypothetical protein